MASLNTVLSQASVINADENGGPTPADLAIDLGDGDDGGGTAEKGTPEKEAELARIASGALSKRNRELALEGVLPITRPQPQSLLKMAQASRQGPGPGQRESLSHSSPRSQSKLNAGRRGGTAGTSGADVFAGVSGSLDAVNVRVPAGTGLKSRFMAKLLEAAAGRNWVSVRRSLRLWPLRFESVKLEREYQLAAQSALLFDAAVAQLVLLGGILVFVLTAVAATALKWLPTKPTSWVVAEFTTQGLVVVLNLIPFYALYWRDGRLLPHYEAIFYWCTLIAITITFWTDVLVWEFEEKIKAANPLQFLPALMWHVPYQFYSVLASFVVVNILLNTRTRLSFYYHLSVLLSYLISRASGLKGTEQQLPSVGAAKGVGLALILVGSFAGRYFRELQDRANIVQALDAQEKLGRVRAILTRSAGIQNGPQGGGGSDEEWDQKFDSDAEGGVGRPSNQSSAEKLLLELSGVNRLLYSVREENYGPEATVKIDKTMENLKRVQTALTSHDALRDVESSLAAAAGRAGSTSTSDGIAKAVIFAFANPALQGGAKATKIGAGSGSTSGSGSGDDLSGRGARGNASDAKSTPRGMNEDPFNASPTSNYGMSSGGLLSGTPAGEGAIALAATLTEEEKLWRTRAYEELSRQKEREREEEREKEKEGEEGEGNDVERARRLFAAGRGRRGGGGGGDKAVSEASPLSAVSGMSGTSMTGGLGRRSGSKSGMDTFPIWSEEYSEKIGIDLTFAFPIDRPGILYDVTMLCARDSLGNDRELFQTFSNVILAIESLHFANPSSNAGRSALCTHSYVSFLRACGIWPLLDSVEKLALLVASAGRAVGSPGVGSQYMLMTNSRLSFLIDDQKVLETFSCFIIFSILHKKGGQVFGSLARERYMKVRKLIVSLISSSNYGSHFELLSQVRLRRISPDFNPVNDSEDRWLLCRLAFRASDLIAEGQRWPFHQELVLRRTAELYQQGDLEVKYGFTVHPICDRLRFHMLPTWEINFIKSVCEPYFDELAMFDLSMTIASVIRPRTAQLLNRWQKIRAGTLQLPPVPSSLERLSIAGLPGAIELWHFVAEAESVEALADADKSPTLKHQALSGSGLGID